MEETFDTFTHRTKVYYLLQAGSIAFFLFLFAAYKYNLQKPKALLIAVFVAGLVIVISNMILTFTQTVKMYLVDGKINFSDKGIKINSISIPFENIKNIKVSAKDYRGARASDGSGNKIEITDNNSKLTTYRFVIESRDQRDRLKDIMETWKAKGLSVQQIGF